MALEKNKYSQIPSDAIILTEEEALNYQKKILYNWKHPSDVFAFKYGTYILGNAAMLTGVYFNNFYRKLFHLKHYGRFATYLPACILPASVVFILHEQFVLNNIALLKQNECPVCLEIRSASIQATAGCILPLLMAPILNLGLAHKYFTYDLPYVTKEPKKLLKLVIEKSKPIKNIAFFIFVAQALLGCAATYFEANSIYNVNFKLSNLAKQFEEKVQ